MLKLGKINYANVLPIYYYLQEERFKGQMQVITQIPAELNRKMAAGELHAGPISSFSYAQHKDHYLVLPDLSVSCFGQVRSIYLFSKKPIEELHGASIALTSSSATSVALLKVIIKAFIQIDVTYETMTPQLEKMLNKHDAALLIGDDAIRAKWAGDTPYVYDVGALWHQFSGKMMTYAVWVVRKDATAHYASLLEELYLAFMDSKHKVAKNLRPMVADISQSFGGDPSFWIEYFSGLSYDFTEKHIDGVETFYQLAYEQGLLQEPCKVQRWDPNKPVMNL